MCARGNTLLESFSKCIHPSLFIPIHCGLNPQQGEGELSGSRYSRVYLLALCAYVHYLVRAVHMAKRRRENCSYQSMG